MPSESSNVDGVDTLKFPPRRSMIKFKIENEDEYRFGKTAYYQPRKSSKNYGFVNIEEEGLKPYSVEWEKVIDWSIVSDSEVDENEQLSNDEHSHIQNDQTANHNQSHESREKQENEDIEQTIHAEKNQTEQGKENDEALSNSDGDSSFGSYLPPYQPRKEKSDTSSDESVGSSISHISEKLHQMSLNDRSQLESTQKSIKKRTPMRTKIVKLKNELKLEQDKVEELQLLIKRITESDENKLRKDLSDAIKLQLIYKEEMKKLLEKRNETHTEPEGSDVFELHPNTLKSVHRNKSDLLNINSTLQKKLEKLESELSTLKKSCTEMATELSKEKNIHKEYDILQLKMFGLEETDPQKLVYENEQELKKKQCEIERLFRINNEMNNNLNEQSKEISYLKETNSQIVHQNSQMKAMQLKDEIISYKNESIITLLNYKLKTCEAQYEKLQKYLSTASSEPIHQNNDPIVNRNEKQNPAQSKNQERQGLPNTMRNACYILSTFHSLAVSIPRVKQQIDDPLMKLIKQTRDCLEGHKSSNEAEEIIQKIWDYTKTQWPTIYSSEGTMTQEDPAEYLRRLLLNETLADETELFIKIQTKCYNDECDLILSEKRETTNIVKADYENKTEITLQEVTDTYMNNAGLHNCAQCRQEISTKNTVKKAPNTLIIEVPRGSDLQEKNHIKVEHDEYISLHENQKLIKYKISAVIRHEGEEINSGHYIINYFNENIQQWEDIDDHEIRNNNNYNLDNEKGVIFIMKKVEEFDENPKEPPRQYEKRQNQPPYHKSRETKSMEERYRDLNERDKETYKSIAEKYKNCPQNLLGNRKNNEMENRSQARSPHRRTEQEMIEMKKKNIIIRGIEEQSPENDIQIVVELNRAMGNNDFNQSNIVRAERIGENYERGRPLKIELDSYTTKIQIMRNVHYLQETRKFRNVKIQHDLTKAQMAEYRQLIQESIEQERNDPTGKYRVRGPPGQWDIVRYQKNY